MQLSGRVLGGQNPRSSHYTKKRKRLLVKGFLHLLYDCAPSFTKAWMVSIQTEDRHEYFVVSVLLMSDVGSGISMPFLASQWAVSRSPSSLTLALWPQVGLSRAVTAGACVPRVLTWVHQLGLCPPKGFTNTSMSSFPSSLPPTQLPRHPGFFHS